MRLVEFMENHNNVTVYHGARAPHLEGALQVPFFCTPVYRMARTYACDRGWGNGAIFKFVLNSSKIAIEETVYEVANELGIDHTDYTAADLISPQIMNDAEMIIEELIDRGFECVFMQDFGTDCPFTEHDAYCVLSPCILSGYQIVETGL